VRRRRLAFLLARDGLPVWLARRLPARHVYLGTNYDRDIDAALAQQGGLRRQAGAPAAAATERMWPASRAALSGAHGVRPRALGARSIIASPADHAINDDLNRRLERSEFIALRPLCADEDAERVFDITPVNRYAARFMTITCGVKPEWRAKIPAVVHCRRHARARRSCAMRKSALAAILRRFATQRAAVLVNTSFNVHEERSSTAVRMRARAPRRPHRFCCDRARRSTAGNPVCHCEAQRSNLAPQVVTLGLLRFARNDVGNSLRHARHKGPFSTTLGVQQFVAIATQRAPRASSIGRKERDMPTEIRRLLGAALWPPLARRLPPAQAPQGPCWCWRPFRSPPRSAGRRPPTTRCTCSPARAGLEAEGAGLRIRSAPTPGPRRSRCRCRRITSPSRR